MWLICFWKCLRKLRCQTVAYYSSRGDEGGQNILWEEFARNRISIELLLPRAGQRFHWLLAEGGPPWGCFRFVTWDPCRSWLLWDHTPAHHDVNSSTHEIIPSGWALSGSGTGVCTVHSNIPQSLKEISPRLPHPVGCLCLRCQV